MLSDAFAMLAEWRHLPAYQLERRVDVFFGLFMPEIVAHLYDRETPDATGADVRVMVVPEFPLHKGLLGIANNDQSVKVDFAVFRRKPKEKQIFLVELKTDCTSISDTQLKNMLKAKRIGPEKLLSGVLKAAKASKEKRKYAQLLWRLGDKELGCIDGTDGFKQMRMANQPKLTESFRCLSVGEGWSEADVRLVLIRPKKCPREDKDENVKKLVREFCRADFLGIAQAVRKSPKPFASSFARYLCEWASTPAGYAHPWA